MKGVDHSDGVLVIHFDTDEAGLLAGVVDQLTEILGDDAQPVEVVAPDDDPFAAWEAGFSEENDSLDSLDDDDESDPVLDRLFPQAYPDDPAASRDFQRFTQADLRGKKVADARTVIADLQHTDRRGRCRVRVEHTGAWLKTLTAVRLALAVRLDITDEISAGEAAQHPESDPRSFLHEIYAWVGWLQECLLDAL